MTGLKTEPLFTKHLSHENYTVGGENFLPATINEELEALLPRLWRFCASLTSQRAAAEDLFQSCCLRILERQEQFAVGTRFDHWAFRIAKNLWFNELRSQRVREGKGFAQDSVDDLIAEGKNADWMVLRAEVFKAVMQLPEAQRIAIILVYVEGFTYAETADILEVPVGTVMSRLATGRRALRVLSEDAKAVEHGSSKQNEKMVFEPRQSTSVLDGRLRNAAVKSGGSTTLS